MTSGYDSAEWRSPLATRSPLPEATPSNEPLSLRSYLEGLQAHVSEFAGAWVIAEVLSAQLKGNVFYFELAESDALGGRAAVANAKLWRNREGILAAFRRVAGENPRAGMRLLVHLKPTFHAQYGLSLDIDAIDPSYTLGDIEERLKQVRQKLKDAGLYDRNREHVCPEDFHHIAVISPDRAAALGDFREAADRLEATGLCRFSYHTATFQGTGMVESLLGAMVAVMREHKQTPYCALCLIRGGGSVADLAELNQFRLAHAVCCARLPILTGIGHERDNVLLDEVASRRFDTPSKVILHIEQAIYRGAQSASADWNTVLGGARRSTVGARHVLETLRESITDRALSKSRLAMYALDTDRQRVADAAQAALGRARHENDSLYAGLARDARHALADSRKALKADMERIVGMGPAHTLVRGFAVVRDGQGHAIPSRQNALEATTDALTIEFRDGSLEVRREESGQDDDGG